MDTKDLIAGYTHYSDAAELSAVDDAPGLEPTLTTSTIMCSPTVPMPTTTRMTFEANC